jgi:hypothetical protein
VLPWESRCTHRNSRGGAGRRPGRWVLERLEDRELMAYTPLGFSLPDLTVTGYASTAASWGEALTVTVNVQNLGSSTLIEPTQLAPAAPSSADSNPTTVAVFLSKTPHPTGDGKNTIRVGSFPIPSVDQNSLFRTTQTLTLPSRPKGFPGNGEKVFISFKVNPDGGTIEADTTNNRARGTPVQIASPLPKLVATALDVPATMQPGDTIAPVIRIANIGPADTAPQGPLTVALVASTSDRFDSGSSIIATYTVANVPGLSTVSSGSADLGDENVEPQANIVTITGSPVTLPVSPKVYNIGVVIDPNRTIQQAPRIGGHAHAQPRNTLSLRRQVGPRVLGLPPAGVLFPGGGANNRPFPFPPNVTATNTSTLPQTGVFVG